MQVVLLAHRLAVPVVLSVALSELSQVIELNLSIGHLLLEAGWLTLRIAFLVGRSTAVGARFEYAEVQVSRTLLLGLGSRSLVREQPFRSALAALVNAGQVRSLFRCSLL